MKKRKCFITICKNDDNLNPEKVFFELPRSHTRKREWLDIAGIKEKKHCKRMYCCEDHFDLKSDSVNFDAHVKFGARLALKQSAVPHRHIKRLDRRYKRKADPMDEFYFVSVDTAPTGESDSTSSAQIDSLLFDTESPILDEFEEIENIVKIEPIQITEVKCEITEEFQNDWQGQPPDITDFQLQKLNGSKNIKKGYKRTSFGTPKAIEPPKKVCSCKCSADPIAVTPMQTSENVINFDEPGKSSHNFDKMQRQLSTLQLLQMSPNFYLGIPINMMGILKSISIKEKIFSMDLLITLNKLRLNDSFIRLSLDFSLGINRIQDIFKNTVPKLANGLKDSIKWPEREIVPKNCFSTTTHHYIDILKVKIELPTVPNKIEKEIPGGSAVKFMICYSDLGVINYISPILPMEIADIEVITYSQLFLSKIPDHVKLFVHKHINLKKKVTKEGLLLLQDYTEKFSVGLEKEDLIHFLYERVHSKISYIEEKEEKHVKKRSLVGKIRQFSILKEHSKIPSDLVPFLDDIFRIVCALVNIQENPR